MQRWGSIMIEMKHKKAWLRMIEYTNIDHKIFIFDPVEDYRVWVYPNWCRREAVMEIYHG